MKAVPYHYCFEALANELRVEILNCLQKKPRSVKELAKTLDVEQSRVSHALKALRECNYVAFKTQGKQRIYALKEGTKKPITAMDSLNALAFAETHFEECCKYACSKRGGTR